MNYHWDFIWLVDVIPMMMLYPNLERYSPGLTPKTFFT